jgi:hypothetical protein
MPPSSRPPTARWTASSTTVHQYRFFFYLANELTVFAQRAPAPIDAFRYAVGAVIMSHTAIETYVTHLLFADEYPVQRELLAGMSDDLLGKVERMAVHEKIELGLRFYRAAQPQHLKPDREPFQSFRLLQQARNFLVHYVPRNELIWSETGEHLLPSNKLEARLRGVFTFPRAGEGEPQAFVYRVFNVSCAEWAFGCVVPFVKAVATAFGVPEPRLEPPFPLADHGQRRAPRSNKAVRRTRRKSSER